MFVCAGVRLAYTCALAGRGACSFAAGVCADLSARRAVCCCSSVTNDTRLQRYTTDNSPDGEIAPCRLARFAICQADFRSLGAAVGSLAYQSSGLYHQSPAVRELNSGFECQPGQLLARVWTRRGTATSPGPSDQVAHGSKKAPAARRRCATRGGLPNGWLLR